MDDLGILIEVPAHSFERDAQSNILNLKAFYTTCLTKKETQI